MSIPGSRSLDRHLAGKPPSVRRIALAALQAGGEALLAARGHDADAEGGERADLGADRSPIAGDTSIGFDRVVARNPGYAVPRLQPINTKRDGETGDDGQARQEADRRDDLRGEDLRLRARLGADEQARFPQDERGAGAAPRRSPASAFRARTRPSRGARSASHAGRNPTPLDPQKTTLLVAHEIAWQIYDSLIYLDEAGTVYPGLATSWEFSNEGKTVTFKLREGVNFHDGSPFNAEVVRWTVERHRAETTVVAHLVDAGPHRRHRG